MTDRPSREEIDRAWGPLESLTVWHSNVHACAKQHADGQLSELTAKLVAVEMVGRIREILATGGWTGLKIRQLYHDREEVTVAASRGNC